MCKKNVQTGCANMYSTGYKHVQGIYIAAVYGWWRITTVRLFLKLSHVNVMRLCLSLGA